MKISKHWGELRNKISYLKIIANMTLQKTLTKNLAILAVSLGLLGSPLSAFPARTGFILGPNPGGNPPNVTLPGGCTLVTRMFTQGAVQIRAIQFAIFTPSGTNIHSYTAFRIPNINGGLTISSVFFPRELDAATFDRECGARGTTVTRSNNPPMPPGPRWEDGQIVWTVEYATGGTQYRMEFGWRNDSQAIFRGNFVNSVIALGPEITPPVPSSAAELTEALIAKATLARSQALLANQIDLVPFLADRNESAFDLGVTRGQVDLDYSSRSNAPVWLHFNLSKSSNVASDSLNAFGIVGSHRQLNENLIVGAMLQFDVNNFEDGTEAHDSQGWLAGPYFVVSSEDKNYFVEGTLLYGQTSNDVSPTGAYTDNYKSDRLLASLKFAKESSTEEYKIRHYLRLQYVVDESDDYTDSLSNSIQGSKVELGELALGINAVVPLEVKNGDMNLLLGTSGIYAFTSGGGGAAGFVENVEGMRARVDLGVDWSVSEQSNLTSKVYVDGIGTSGQSSVGASLRYDVRF